MHAPSYLLRIYQKYYGLKQWPMQIRDWSPTQALGAETMPYQSTRNLMCPVSRNLEWSAGSWFLTNGIQNLIQRPKSIYLWGLLSMKKLGNIITQFPGMLNYPETLHLISMKLSSAPFPTRIMIPSQSHLRGRAIHTSADQKWTPHKPP